jgi:hypothetical protein
MAVARWSKASQTGPAAARGAHKRGTPILESPQGQGACEEALTSVRRR